MVFTIISNTHSMLLIIIYGISKHLFGAFSRMKHAVVCIRDSEFLLIIKLFTCIMAEDATAKETDRLMDAILTIDL